jgi:hypothetical protein
MALQISGQSYKTGAPGQTIPQDQQNAVLVSELNARYYVNAYSGQTFFAANTAAQALSVASATYTGLAVANPAGSGKNLIIIDAAFGLQTLQSGFSAIVLAYAPTVTLTTGSSSGPGGLSTIVGGGAASVAKVGASATLGAAPTIARIMAGAQWVTTGTTSNIQIVKDEVAGALIIPPGQLVCIEAITTAVTGLAHITWVELPI